ncbi:MAG: hypothetical protein ABSE56_15715 [Bryobacteraceae bacterium]
MWQPFNHTRESRCPATSFTSPSISPRNQEPLAVSEKPSAVRWISPRSSQRGGHQRRHDGPYPLFESILQDTTLRRRRLARLAAGRSSRFSRFQIAPDGSLLAAASESSAYLWSLRDLRFLAVLSCQAAGTINALEFTPDNRLLACATGNGAVVLWDLGKRSVHGMLFDPAAAGIAPAPARRCTTGIRTES